MLSAPERSVGRPIWSRSTRYGRATRMPTTPITPRTIAWTSRLNPSRLTTAAPSAPTVMKTANRATVMTSAFWFWVIVAIVFAIAEVLTVALFAVFIPVGALGAAVVRLLGVNPLVPAVVLGVIGVVGILVARPYLVDRLHIGRPTLRSGADSMVGQHAVLIEPIGGLEQPGHVMIAGELWPALTEDGSSVPAATPV